MDLKQIQEVNEKYGTPKSEIHLFSKRISNSVCDSPFRNMPNVSTPPSRFSKITNPFEAHLIERLHLPTFSPSVFATISTPNKSSEKFKWAIEDISSLKPADIDETTVSQHVCIEDPHIESIVQQKIDTFFSSKSIVPSPMMNQGASYKTEPLIRHYVDSRSPLSCDRKPQCSDGATQTVLTLPPHLPEALEKALLPFFTYHEDQQQNFQRMSLDVMECNATLYKQLFEAGSPKTSVSKESIESSPALSTGYALSPFQFSPLTEKGGDVPELNDCNLSPIGRHSSPSAGGNNGRVNRSTLSERSSRSACRLNFTERMSIDVSGMVVPDMDNTTRTIGGKSLCLSDDDRFSPVLTEPLSDSTVNWDMEYKHVSLVSSPASSIGSVDDKMDISNSNTPHSKIFTSQRKRLSESFKDIEDCSEYENNKENELYRTDTTVAGGKSNKMFRNNDVTADAGYHTQDGATSSSLLRGSSDCAESLDWAAKYSLLHVFASTPSKNKM